MVTALNSRNSKLVVVTRKYLALCFIAGILTICSALALLYSLWLSALLAPQTPAAAFTIGVELCKRESSYLTSVQPPLLKGGRYGFQCGSGKSIDETLLDIDPEVERVRGKAAAPSPQPLLSSAPRPLPTSRVLADAQRTHSTER